MEVSLWRLCRGVFFLGLLLLLCSGFSGLAFALQDGSSQTADAVLEPNSNRIVWRERAQGAFTNVQGSLEYKYIRYQGKIIHTHVKSWGQPFLVAYVGVTNVNDRPYVLDSKRDISIQLRLMGYYMLPLQADQLVKLLQRGGKHDKEIAKDIQQRPWTLGLVTINGDSQWDQLFYFHPDTKELFFSVKAYERTGTALDVQVYLDGVAFVFPFKVGE